MKRDAEQVLGDMSFAFEGSNETFLDKGTNGRWRVLSSDEALALYRVAMARTLAPDCARWLESGGSVS